MPLCFTFLGLSTLPIWTRGGAGKQMFFCQHTHELIDSKSPSGGLRFSDLRPTSPGGGCGQFGGQVSDAGRRAADGGEYLLRRWSCAGEPMTAALASSRSPRLGRHVTWLRFLAVIDRRRAVTQSGAERLGVACEPFRPFVCDDRGRALFLLYQGSPNLSRATVSPVAGFIE